MLWLGNRFFGLPWLANPDTLTATPKLSVLRHVGIGWNISSPFFQVLFLLKCVRIHSWDAEFYNPVNNILTYKIHICSSEKKQKTKKKPTNMHLSSCDWSCVTCSGSLHSSEGRNFILLYLFSFFCATMKMNTVVVEKKLQHACTCTCGCVDSLVRSCTILPVVFI